MILSKRERYIVVATVAVLLLLGLDRYALSPLLASKTQLEDKIALVRQDLERDDRLLKNKSRNQRKWNEMIESGLAADASAAESQVLNALREWAQESRFTLSSVKPERTENEKQFQKITFRAAGTGNLDAAGRFLYRLRTASIPVRITDMQLNSRKDGSDDLTLQLGISTLFLAPEPEKTAKAAAAAPGTGDSK